jgi:hypothetical protein
MTRPEILQEVKRLKQEWEQTLHDLAGRTRPDAYEREQEAWDALIDFIELNSLNYSEHDPRDNG